MQRGNDDDKLWFHLDLWGKMRLSDESLFYKNNETFYKHFRYVHHNALDMSFTIHL